MGKEMCETIISFKPIVVVTEKGVSDIAIHFLVKAGITCLRRLRKTDNNRLAKCTGATIVNKVEEIQESDLGTKCGLYECKKLGDERVRRMRYKTQLRAISKHIPN